MTLPTIQPIDPREWQEAIDQVLKAAYQKEAARLGRASFPPLERPATDLIDYGHEFLAAINTPAIALYTVLGFAESRHFRTPDGVDLLELRAQGG